MQLRSSPTVLALLALLVSLSRPYIVLARKTLNQSITHGEVPGTRYGLSKSGWMDLILFSTWFKEHFLPYAPSARPLLLLIDGHKSHFCPDMIKLAANEGVIIFALPPNTTHLCQPLDKGPFAPLKVAWRKAVQQFISANNGRVVTLYEFNTVFAQAWYNGMTAGNVISGFRCTGIFPFNRHAVMEKIDRFQKFDPNALSRETNIHFIPLFSPDRTHRDRHYDFMDESTDSDSSFYLPQPLDFSLERSYSDGHLDQVHSLPFIKPALLKEHLITPLPVRRKGRGPPPKGRVLTSRDNLILIEEQEQKKAEAAKLKEERKKAREEKQKKKKQKSGAYTNSHESLVAYSLLITCSSCNYLLHF